MVAKAEYTFDVSCVFIYNKAEDVSKHYRAQKANEHVIALPNVGRESHTYLTYINSMYDTLPEHVIFLQGNPFDHTITLQKIQNVIDAKGRTRSVSGYDVESDGKGLPHHPGLNIDGLYTNLFGSKAKHPVSYRYSFGAQYIVAKDSILSKPKTFWKNALDISMTSTMFPWEVERLWLYMFDPAHVYAL